MPRRTWILLWGQTGLSVAVLVAALTFISLEDSGVERLPGLPGVLQGGALLAVVLPLLLSLAVLVWRLADGGALSTPALASPLLACVVALPLFAGLRVGAQQLALTQRARAEAEALAALRSSPAQACSVVVRDPHATAQEQAQCLNSLEALAPTVRWSALAGFLGPNGFATWNPQELGTNDSWELGREVPKFAPAQQPRFLALALEAAAAQPRTAALDAQLAACLRRLFVQDWSPEAQAQTLAWMAQLRESPDAGL